MTQDISQRLARPISILLHASMITLWSDLHKHTGYGMEARSRAICPVIAPKVISIAADPLFGGRVERRSCDIFRTHDSQTQTSASSSNPYNTFALFLIINLMAITVSL
ncbi:hypothetical protein TNCV_2803801 [Trichonephila clavipes]|nr:hypothetical protein TNCV_2803801 [Trichonephila clavipes]